MIEGTFFPSLRAMIEGQDIGNKEEIYSEGERVDHIPWVKKKSFWNANQAQTRCV